MAWRVYICLAVLLASSTATASRGGLAVAGGHDPTEGFTALRRSERNFELQHPYNIPGDERYRFHGGVRQLWVLESDKPHARRSHTSPRTEIRFSGYDYSSGVWQFEGYGYVPSGTTGVCIMQVFGADETASTLMLHVYDGALHYYDRQVVEDNIYDRWFRLNVVHDVGADKLTVFVDGKEKLHAPGRGGSSHYFKFGVYTQRHASSCMESRWKGIKILKNDSLFVDIDTITLLLDLQLSYV